MVVDDVELVEHTHVGLGDVRDPELLVVGQERIGATAGPCALLALLSPGRLLARDVGEDADLEPDPTIDDDLVGGRHRHQRAGSQRPFTDLSRACPEAHVAFSLWGQR